MSLRSSQKLHYLLRGFDLALAVLPLDHLFVGLRLGAQHPPDCFVHTTLGFGRIDWIVRLRRFCLLRHHNRLLVHRSSIYGVDSRRRRLANWNEHQDVPAVSRERANPTRDTRPIRIQLTGAPTFRKCTEYLKDAYLYQIGRGSNQIGYTHQSGSQLKLPFKARVIANKAVGKLALHQHSNKLAEFWGWAKGAQKIVHSIDFSAI